MTWYSVQLKDAKFLSHWYMHRVMYSNVKYANIKTRIFTILCILFHIFMLIYNFLHLFYWYSISGRNCELTSPRKHFGVFFANVWFLMILRFSSIHLEIRSSYWMQYKIEKRFRASNLSPGKKLPFRWECVTILQFR